MHLVSSLMVYKSRKSRKKDGNPVMWRTETNQLSGREVQWTSLSLLSNRRLTFRRVIWYNPPSALKIIIDKSIIECFNPGIFSAKREAVTWHWPPLAV